MQELREKVYCQGEEPMIHDDFPLDVFFCWEDPGLPLRNIGHIKELRGFERSIQERLSELEAEPEPNETMISQERAILEATRKEIQRLEKQSLYSQLGPC